VWEFLRFYLEREMENVINLTKFKTTSELANFGVQDISSWSEFKEIRDLLYFPSAPTMEIINQRVERLGEIAVKESKKTGHKTVLVSCPPWMTAALCRELMYHGITPVVSFTKKSIEEGLTVIALVPAA